jgi:hypothetical protein
MQRRIKQLITKAVQPRARAGPNSSDAGTPAHAEARCLRLDARGYPVISGLSFKLMVVIDRKQVTFWRSK